MAEDTTYCPYCGASMNAGATFCPSCGAQIPAQGAPAGAAPAPGASAYGQQYNNPNAKLESNLRTIGIITIVLTVIAAISAIIMFAMVGTVDTMNVGSVEGMTEQQVRDLYKAVYTVMAVGCLPLLIVGAIASYCCMKKTSYNLGLAMYIIAIILSICAGGIIGIIIAVLLLVFYTKTKPVFDS